MNPTPEDYIINELKGLPIFCAGRQDVQTHTHNTVLMFTFVLSSGYIADIIVRHSFRKLATYHMYISSGDDTTEYYGDAKEILRLIQEHEHIHTHSKP